MRYQNIEQFVTQFPIYQYEFIDSAEIEFNKKVQVLCKKECLCYGTSWSCPPAIGNIDKCKEKCLNFPKALVFSSIAEKPNNADEAGLLKTRHSHRQITRQITKFLKVNNVPCYALSTGACSLCDKCTYPKKSCVKQESMIPCIESHRILMANLLDKLQMDYLIDESMMILFSIIFVEED